MSAKGTNGLLSVNSYGSYHITVMSISHGVKVIAGPPDEARNFRAFYMSKRTSGTFSIGLHFSSQQEAAKFSQWMEGYGTRVNQPNAVGSMRVTVPSRSFDRVGVPVSGATFGDSVGQIGYAMRLGFDGAREDEAFKSPIVSSFVGAVDDTESRFFYPAGDQLKGLGSAEDVLYGVPEGTTAIVNIFKNLFGGGGASKPPADNIGGNQR